jgi:DNA-directed RNA polymerase subunit K/omega
MDKCVLKLLNATSLGGRGHIRWHSQHRLWPGSYEIFDNHCLHNIVIFIDKQGIFKYNTYSQGEAMTVRIESRNTLIDTERCVEHAGGRYDLVIAASQRLREMKRRARETNDFVTPIDALMEVQSGTFNMTDYLAKVK